MRIVWTAPALGDLRALRVYIAHEKPAAAVQQVEHILAAVDGLMRFPESGRPGRRAGMRELVVGKTPYIVAYRLRGNCGVPIYNKPVDKPEFIGIYVGSLDDATAFKPAVVLYCARGYTWDFLDPDVPKLPGWHPK
jgi:plasmid stabilization system protein ParE